MVNRTGREAKGPHFHGETEACKLVVIIRQSANTDGSGGIFGGCLAASVPSILGGVLRHTDGYLGLLYYI